MVINEELCEGRHSDHVMQHTESIGVERGVVIRRLLSLTNTHVIDLTTLCHFVSVLDADRTMKVPEMYIKVKVWIYSLESTRSYYPELTVIIM